MIKPGNSHSWQDLIDLDKLKLSDDSEDTSRLPEREKKALLTRVLQTALNYEPEEQKVTTTDELSSTGQINIPTIQQPFYLFTFGANKLSSHQL